MSNNKNNSTEDFFQGLYSAEFLPKELKLNEFSYSIDTSAEESADNRIQETVNPSLQQTNSGPISARESLEIDKKIRQTIERIESTRSKIADTKDNISNLMADAAAAKGGEIQYVVPTKGNPALKKAIRKVFGVNSSNVTYSMYLEALAIKDKLENEQVEGYVAGDFFLEEEEE